MANIRPPEGFEIAALREKKQGFFNLLTAGSGTPWEMRGELGLSNAFFKTASAAMFSPAVLLHQIRRPETSTDVKGFVLGCGLFWAFSWVIHSIWIYWIVSNDPAYIPNPQVYFLGTGFQFFIGLFAPFILLKLFCAVFLKLVATEFQKQAPAVLVFNVNGYALGPSILAPIPFIGPVIALIWIIINLCVAGTRRLRLSIGGTIISTLISLLVVTAVCAGSYYCGAYIWRAASGGGGMPSLKELQSLHGY